ncbi:NUDIX hydrolase [Candidatus Kaiserbacteria bacterium]|nr:NUDIX hydrolase [Candidatus Kaiserbacteria bacterium]
MIFEPLTKKLWTRINLEVRACVQEGEERATVATIIRRRGKYLIITSSHGAGGGYFNPGIVKGGVERGETALAALFREIPQELGIRRALLKLIGYGGAYSVASTSARKKGYTKKRYYIFYVTYTGPQKLRINGELSGFYWMTLPEVHRVLQVLLLPPERQEKFDVLTDAFSSLQEQKGTLFVKKKRKSSTKKPPRH